MSAPKAEAVMRTSQRALVPDRQLGRMLISLALLYGLAVALAGLCAVVAG